MSSWDGNSIMVRIRILYRLVFFFGGWSGFLTLFDFENIAEYGIDFSCPDRGNEFLSVSNAPRH